MADFTMDRFSLKGKTALVTGAERGIGLEIAKGLAAAGANIIIAGLMEEEFPKAKAAVRAKGVTMPPGATQLTLMPYCLSSLAMPRVMPTTPAFAVL